MVIEISGKNFTISHFGRSAQPWFVYWCTYVFLIFNLFPEHAYATQRKSRAGIRTRDFTLTQTCSPLPHCAAHISCIVSYGGNRFQCLIRCTYVNSEGEERPWRESDTSRLLSASPQHPRRTASAALVPRCRTAPVTWPRGRVPQRSPRYRRMPSALAVSALALFSPDRIYGVSRGPRAVTVECGEDLLEVPRLGKIESGKFLIHFCSWDAGGKVLKSICGQSFVLKCHIWFFFFLNGPGHEIKTFFFFLQQLDFVSRVMPWDTSLIAHWAGLKFKLLLLLHLSIIFLHQNECHDYVPASKKTNKKQKCVSL